MLGDDLTANSLASVAGALHCAGVRSGYAYSERSDDRGAAKAEPRVLISNSRVGTENPAFALGHGGHWYAALTVGDEIHLYRSREHTAAGSWAAYQTVT